MIVTRNRASQEPMETPHKVDARNLYNSSDLIVTVITLKPGQKLKKHITPVDVVFYVLSGSGRVLIGAEETVVTAGTLVESPRNILHCWINESADDLSFMVIKAPRPTEATTFLE